MSVSCVVLSLIQALRLMSYREPTFTMDQMQMLTHSEPRHIVPVKTLHTTDNGCVFFSFTPETSNFQRLLKDEHTQCCTKCKHAFDYNTKNLWTVKWKTKMRLTWATFAFCKSDWSTTFAWAANRFIHWTVKYIFKEDILYCGTDDQQSCPHFAHLYLSYGSP